MALSTKQAKPWSSRCRTLIATSVTSKSSSPRSRAAASGCWGSRQASSNSRGCTRQNVSCGEGELYQSRREMLHLRGPSAGTPWRAARVRAAAHLRVFELRVDAGGHVRVRLQQLPQLTARATAALLNSPQQLHVQRPASEEQRGEDIKGAGWSACPPPATTGNDRPASGCHRGSAVSKDSFSQPPPAPHHPGCPGSALPPRRGIGGRRKPQ